MPVLYPALGAGCLAVSFLLLLTYWLWDRTMVILALAVHFLAEAATLLVLTLATGHHPYLDIAMFRIWIVWLRFAMLVNLLAVIFWQIRRFSER
jgi:hypothetical protein